MTGAATTVLTDIRAFPAWQLGSLTGACPILIPRQRR